jgi:hypothetical protein
MVIRIKHVSSTLYIITAALTHSVEQSSAEQKRPSIGQEMPHLYDTRKFIIESVLLGPTLNNIKPLVTSLNISRLYVTLHNIMLALYVVELLVPVHPPSHRNVPC